MSVPLKSVTAILVGALCLAANATGSDEAGDIVVYAHMANTIAAVDWAMSVGVNAVEMDLQFKNDGTPEEFKHGGVCDCSCTEGCIFKSSCKSGTVCFVLWESGSSCNASVDAVTMAKNLAKHPEQLAVVYIDSKVDESVDLAAAGQAVIDLLDRNTFGTDGFAGQVVISTPTIAEIAYTKAAVKAAEASPNRASYYFTIDQEGDDFVSVAEALVPLTENRGFSTGITACLPETFYEAIELSALNQDHEVMSFTSIWSLNDESSMETYLEDGANGLMTNIPSHALAALSAQGLTLAKPGRAFQPSTNDQIITHVPTLSE